MRRRAFLGAVGAMALAGPLRAGTGNDPAATLDLWMRLVLQLIRHTATYSPPVAARAFAYLGVTIHAASRAAHPALPAVDGMFPSLAPLPAAPAGADPAAVMQGALAGAVTTLFGNTGPTGQRAMAAMRDRLAADLPAGPATDSGLAHGAALAQAIARWSDGDGGTPVQNMGFPYDYRPGPAPGDWRPTSRIVQQQAPLLPHWGQVRTLAITSPADCPIAPPHPYSEAADSAFRREAEEVMVTVNTLTEEQRLIARFWSDDPMLSPTPPGHWWAIARQIVADDAMAPGQAADLYLRLGIAMHDAFVACWDAKFRHNLLRPVTYINRVLDPAWQPILITPPFPEYPSGHAVLSGAASTVLAGLLGADRGFIDTTHENEGFDARPFASFSAAADEAAISRLYGGIHFRAACDNGLAQGRLVGAAALRLAPA